MKKALILFLLCVLHFSVKAQVQKHVSNNPIYVNGVNTGDSARLAKNWKLCAQSYAEAFTISKKSYLSLLRAASCHCALGEMEQAGVLAKVAVPIHPDAVLSMVKKLPDLAPFLETDIWKAIKTETEALLAQCKEMIMKAERSYGTGDYVASAQYYQEAIALKPQHPSGDYYNAACSASLAGEDSFAIWSLGRALRSGWTDLTHLQNDSDLDDIRNHPQWDEMLTPLKKYYERFDQKLIAELEEILRTDQNPRGEIVDLMRSEKKNQAKMDSLWAIQHIHDSINLARVTRILDEHGYPGKSKVGAGNMGIAFLVIQHAPLEYQEKYLPMLREAADNKEMAWSSLALLIDRTRLRKGQKQLYGSQVAQNPEDGTFSVSPIEDEHLVDERRKTVDLPPLARYLSSWGIEYTVPEKKDN